MNDIKKILIAIDNGPAIEKIASKAFHLAQQVHAAIALVSIVDTPAVIMESGISVADEIHILKNDFKKGHQLLIENVFKDYQVQTFLGEGKPFEEILRVADEWEADLIVLGTHGRTGLSHVLMGSVAEKVIRHTTKPVLIIPERP